MLGEENMNDMDIGNMGNIARNMYELKVAWQLIITSWTILKKVVD